MKIFGSPAIPAAFGLALAITLAACSGGGGGGGPPPPPADTTAPDTTLAGAPAALTNATTANLTFTSNEANVTFESRLDGAAFAVATSPRNLTNLGNGSHTFDVRARDAAGNVDATPASATWVVDSAPPTGAIVFPTPVSYTDASTLTVRGTAQDASGVTAVSVNGVAAATATNFATWTAVVPLAGGANALSVNVTDAAGNTATAAATASVANRGPILMLPRGADYDPTGDRIIVSDQQTESVLAFRTSDGVGSQISSVSQAATPNNSAIEELVVDSANNRALLLDWGADALVSVNLTTGARTTLSGGNGTGTTQLTIGFGVAYDAANNRAFVTVRATNSVISVNLATGARTVLSSPTVGTGTAFGNPLGIAYDTSGAQPRLLVADAPNGGAAIYQVDIATGNRVLFSQAPGTGTGPGFSGPTSLRLDPANNRLFMLDSTTSTLFSINLANGNRTIIGDDVTGTGETVSSVPGLAYKPAAGVLYAAQSNGEILALDVATLNRTALVHGRIGTGVRPQFPLSALIEQTSGTPTSLLFAEPNLQTITRVNLANGNRTIVSGGAVGSGIALDRAADMVLDTRPAAAGNAALVLLTSPNMALVSVNLTSGQRTLLTSLQEAGQPQIVQARNLRLDAGGNRVLFTNVDFGTGFQGLYAIDLGTLARTTISSATRGSGANFSAPTHFVLEPAANPTRAIVADINPSAMISVNLASGDRSQFISINGTPTLPLVGPLFLDTVNSALLGINIYPEHLYSVPLPVVGAQTRSLISGVTPGLNTIRGTGPLAYFGTGLDSHVASGVAYVSAGNSASIMAIDLVSGDRVIISR